MHSIAADRRPILFTATVFLTVLLIASVAAIYSAPSSTVTLPALSPGYGIILTASVNATTLSLGQELGINISLFNDLPTTNYVPAAYNWTIGGLTDPFWNVCISPNPIDFVVVNGSLSLSEVLAMGNSTGPSFACIEAESIEYIAFQPMSDVVHVNGTSFGGGDVPYQLYGPYSTNSTFAVSGYWDYPLTLAEVLSAGQGALTAAHPFTPGQYTLIVSDEWGRTLTIHFSVV